jgi:mRNA-degrading endonuclease toxin of MazEF toxin-antitoxin module
MMVRREEIYFVSIPNQPKPRPAIILTANWLSRYALDVSVVPVTSVARGNFPTRVELPAGEGGLSKPSWAKCDQVTTIPRHLLACSALGAVSATKLDEIERAVRLALEL